MSSMKIMTVHNFHRKGSASGDDQVFKSETSLLRRHGNQVVTFSVINDAFDQAGAIGKVRTAFGMLWSFQNYRAVRDLIRREQPELVHVHTFFPLLSPSILYAAKRERVSVIATLHDTRFICPCATSLRGGELCNLCGDGHYFRMVPYRCFKGSALQSFLVACIFSYHRKRKTFYRQIDRYICLNNNQIRRLETIGFDPEKISRKYNFVPDAEANLSEMSAESLDLPKLPDRYVVFYGRIGEEKGIRTLMHAWEDQRLGAVPLVVMGGGPLEEEFAAWARGRENVVFMGYTEHALCMQVVRGAQFVVFPSIWYEGCSMVEIETMSLGRGLIATDLGFSAEAVRDGYNGYKFPLHQEQKFIERILHLWNAPEECGILGRNARTEYESKYTEEANYRQLMEIYRETLRRASGDGRA